MIYTQTMHDLGYPPWIPKGVWIGEEECNT
jgi:hypothetical protein